MWCSFRVLRGYGCLSLWRDTSLTCKSGEQLRRKSGRRCERLIAGVLAWSPTRRGTTSVCASTVRCARTAATALRGHNQV